MLKLKGKVTQLLFLLKAASLNEKSKERKKSSTADGTFTPDNQVFPILVLDLVELDKIN